MNHSVRALAVFILTATTATAQDRSNLHTHPSVPDDATLQRFNLKLGWRAYIPMDGPRDRIFTVQNAGDVLLVQTRSGLVSALEAETGHIRWQARFGRPYHVSVPVGFNDQEVLIVSDRTLYVLDRVTGELRWDFDMPTTPTTAAVADNSQWFLSVPGGVVSAYAIPRANPDAKGGADAKNAKTGKKGEATEDSRKTTIGLTSSVGALASARGQATSSLVSVGPLASVRQFSGSATSGVNPHVDWKDGSGLHIEIPPVQTKDTLFIAGRDGRIAALAKGLKREEHYNRQLADGAILAPPGQYGDVAYVAAQDSTLYAVNIPNGTVLWRFTAGTSIKHKPAVTDDDIFVTTSLDGLTRLHRKTGQVIWQNRAADRFLAMNAKVVYATDRSGRLLLLDRSHGTQRGSLDTGNFVRPIANELTDRIYLAANDGLFVCMHDRDYPSPQQNRKVESPNPEKKKRVDKLKDKPKPKAKAEDQEPGDVKEKDNGADKKGDTDKKVEGKDKKGETDEDPDKQ
jgi:outer membrane protein assembly factor BamB